jgi:hypothetical protein
MLRARWVFQGPHKNLWVTDPETFLRNSLQIPVAEKPPEAKREKYTSQDRSPARKRMNGRYRLARSGETPGV